MTRAPGHAYNLTCQAGPAFPRPHLALYRYRAGPLERAEPAQAAPAHQHAHPRPRLAATLLRQEPVPGTQTQLSARPWPGEPGSGAPPAGAYEIGAWALVEESSLSANLVTQFECVLSLEGANYEQRQSLALQKGEYPPGELRERERERDLPGDTLAGRKIGRLAGRRATSGGPGGDLPLAPVGAPGRPAVGWRWWRAGRLRAPATCHFYGHRRRSVSPDRGLVGSARAQAARLPGRWSARGRVKIWPRCEGRARRFERTPARIRRAGPVGHRRHSRGPARTCD